MRRAAKKDRNQDQIVEQLQGLGFSVYKTHGVGSGFPDLVVGGVHRRLNEPATLLVEVKTARGILTDDEEKFFEGWRGAAIVARSAAPILEWFGWPASFAVQFEGAG